LNNGEIFYRISSVREYRNLFPLLFTDNFIAFEQQENSTQTASKSVGK